MRNGIDSQAGRHRSHIASQGIPIAFHFIGLPGACNSKKTYGAESVNARAWPMGSELAKNSGFCMQKLGERLSGRAWGDRFIHFRDTSRHLSSAANASDRSGAPAIAGARLTWLSVRCLSSCLFSASS
jgi:hypothetical protein